MAQAYGANDPRRPEGGHPLRAYAGVGCQVTILRNPARQCEHRDGNTEAFLDPLDDPSPWLAAIVEDQALQDQFQRIGFSFGALRREDSVTVVTTPQLHGLELLVTQALANYACALTKDTTFELGADDGGLGLS